MSGKIVIYQVMPRLLGAQSKNLATQGTKRQNGCGKFSSFTGERLSHIRGLGATHIWYTGILRHSTLTDYSRYGMPADSPSIVKGIAGSPYAVRDYYDVDPDLADSVPHRLDEFHRLVRRTHEAGLKVIIDFVPNHVARSYCSLAPVPPEGHIGSRDDASKCFSPANDFYYLGEGSAFASPAGGDFEERPAKATGNDCFCASPGRFDWYDTVKLNYGVDYLGGRRQNFSPRPPLWDKMAGILLYWCSMGVDGFRCDMSEMVPAEFWHWATGVVRQKYPATLFIAEIYNPAVYERYASYGGFDYLYDKVGLYDMLRAVTCGQRPASDIQYAWQSLPAGMSPRMLNFMENHDEQRIASDFFAGSGERGRAAMAVAALMNVNPVMVYAGQEYGERGMDAEGYSGCDGRTSIFDYWSPSTLRRALSIPAQLTAEERDLRRFYVSLLARAAKKRAVARGLFFDLTYCNLDDYAAYPADRVYSFLRGKGGEIMLVAANFSDRPLRVGIRLPGHAFDYMQIPEGEYAATQLLHGAGQGTAEFSLSRDCRLSVEIPGESAVAWSLRKKH